MVYVMPSANILRDVNARLFDQQLKPRPAIVLAVILTSIIWAGVIAVASFLDNTLRLPAPGRGLLDHYGFQACFLVAPLGLLTVYYAVSYFLRMLQYIPNVLSQHAD